MMWIAVLLISWDAAQTSVGAWQTSTRNYRYGRTYMVSLRPQNWTEAQNMCARRGGQLALIHELTTVPDMEIQVNRTFWVGIRWNGTTVGNKMWSNWASQPVLGNASLLCALVSIESPYWWYATDCSHQHPYICEVRNGSCTYISIKGSALQGLDRAFRSAVTLTQCKQICEDGSLGFTCHSFEHNIKYNYCQFSEWNRWTAPGYFGGDPELNYYHRTCCKTISMEEDLHGTTTELETSSVSGDKDLRGTTTELDTSSVPDDRTVTLETSSDAFSSTDAIDTSSTSVISSSYPDVSYSRILFCTQVWYDDRSSLVSEIFTSEVLPTSTSVTVPESASTNLIENLQDFNKHIKERKKILKRISIPDYRASSISIGTIAIIILVGLMVTLIVLDARTLGLQCIALHRTLCPHCCQCPGRAKYATSSFDSPRTVIATVGGSKTPLPKRFDLLSGESCQVSCGQNLPKDGNILVQKEASVMNEVLHVPNDSVSKSEISHL